MARYLAVLVVFSLAPCAAAQEPIPAMANREVSLVAATPGYRFHSDFWMNMHQYLYGIAGGGPERGTGAEVENGACFDALDAGSGDAWAAAVALYGDGLGERRQRSDALMVAVRYRLNGLGTEHSSDPELVATLSALEEAAPAYATCLWPRHDARNRALVGDLVGMLVQYERPLQRQLSIAYRAPWPESVPVDVVGYLSFAGANTTSRPGLSPHIMIASGQEPMSGFNGLETLLHEASHIVFGPFHGAVTDALEAATEALGVDMPRGGLWHAISFYTSGRAVQSAAAAADARYQPYWLREGIFTQFEPALAEHWQPYLDGTVDIDEAALNLIESLTGP